MEGGTGMPKGVKVKNRAPAPVQITAEQILVESRERAEAAAPPAPRRHISDPSELADHRMRVRKDYEDRLRRLNKSIGTWLRYAKWEDGQGEVQRARSIYERTLDVDFKDPNVWLQYAEMEMRNKFVNRARNVLDRGVALLPRVESLWLKYLFMEEMLGNAQGVRLLFERWMTWEPSERAWLSYAKFEIRAGVPERARAVYERYIACHPSQAAYVKYARWEERAMGQKGLARVVYERALDELREKEKDEALYLAFAAFEEACGEDARVRAVFRLGLERLGAAAEAAAAAASSATGSGAAAAAARKTLSKNPAASLAALHTASLAYEKQHGSVAGIEDAIITRRRATYEDQVGADALNYDAWFDYIRLEEAECAAAAAAVDAVKGGGSGGSSSSSGAGAAAAAASLATAITRTREVYERAVGAVPPVAEKRYWRRYVYLWVGYAAFEELMGGDGSSGGSGGSGSSSGSSGSERARGVWRAALGVIPHRAFTFAKVWLGGAHAEVRGRDVGAARKLLGKALGMCPKPALFRGYIELELALGELDRVRKLYEKYIAHSPTTVATWLQFAELEKSVGEGERARAILNLACSQPALDRPEVAWKVFIDFEIEMGDLGAARELYRKLLSRTQHVKVWLAFARFEATECGEREGARAVFKQGDVYLKGACGGGGGGVSGGGGGGGGDDSDALEARQQRALLLDTWRAFERAGVDAELSGGGDGSETQPHLRAVEAKAPKPVRKRRPLWGGGARAPPPSQPTAPPVAHEEYLDYLFPDEDVKPAHLKLLEAAARWKAGGGAASKALAAGGGGKGGAATAAAAAAAAASAAAAREDDNALDLDAGGEEEEEEGQGLGLGEEGSAAGAGAASSTSIHHLLSSAILEEGSRKRGRGGEGEGEGEEGQREEEESGAVGGEKDGNELDLDDMGGELVVPPLPPPPPPPPPQRKALSLAPPKIS